MGFDKAGKIAQMVMVLALQAWGPGFESPPRVQHISTCLYPKH